MKTFLIEIAAVNCASRLTGTPLYDNYAIYGAMGRLRSVEAGEIRETDGIDDVPQKAESFIFGTRCGAALEKYTAGLDDSRIRIYEAQVARTFVFGSKFAEIGKYSPGELENTLLTVLRALVKRAQIRTHTTKPGYEDINTWLARYNDMQADYDKSLPDFVRAVVCPGEGELKFAEEFLSAKDEIVRLALEKGPVSGEALEKALEQTPVSLFGKYLKDIVQKH